MESKFKYQLTQKSEADLDGIVSYIALELSNPQAATDFVNHLQESIEEARSFPESGSPVVNEYLPSTEVRKKLVDNYIMYYLSDFTEKIIYIVRIVYGKRNMDEIFRKMNL